MKYLLSTLLLSTVVLTSCDKNHSTYSGVKNTSQVSIRYKTLNLDSLKLDSINSSYFGEALVRDSQLFFLDYKFSYLNEFDKNGRFKGQFVGQGSGPDEIPVKTTMLFTFLPNGNALFIGPSWDVFIFDSQFKRIDDYQVNWHPAVTKEEMLRKPDPSQTFLYSFNYGAKIRATNDLLFFPIRSQFPTFNPTIPRYAKDARILAQMDISKGYVDKIFGRFSPAYTQNPNALLFNTPLFDFYPEKTFALTFAADPRIYVVDYDFNVLESFGQEGRSMLKNYKNAKSIETFYDTLTGQLDKDAYYSFIKYIPERQLLFRGYFRGGMSKTDGLQIYERNVLVADVDVPRGFKVTGYIAPFFYSDAYANSDKEEIKIYKFKLEK